MAEGKSKGPWCLKYKFDDDDYPAIISAETGIGCNCISLNNAGFIAAAANNFDAMLAIIDAAKDVVALAECGASDGVMDVQNTYFDRLDLALSALEKIE